MEPYRPRRRGHDPERRWNDQFAGEIDNVFLAIS
jgi:hypothetical protein